MRSFVLNFAPVFFNVIQWVLVGVMSRQDHRRVAAYHAFLWTTGAFFASMLIYSVVPH